MRRQQLTYLLTFYMLYSASDLHENLSEHSSPSNRGHVPKKAYTITKSKICVSSIGVGWAPNKDDVIGGHFVDLVTIYSISFAYKD